MKKTFFLLLVLLPSLGWGEYLENFPTRTFDHKKIIYYNGSFDPFHKGHEAMVAQAKNRADYVIVYANCGKSSRKPNRTAHSSRHKMLDALYAEDPQVILTHLDGYQAQQYLRQIKGATFYALIGSDVIQEFKGHEDVDKIFHRGTPLQPHEGQESKVGMFLVNAKSLYAVSREAESLPKTFLGDRPILPLGGKTPSVSSTLIRKKYQAGEDISALLSPAVLKIIQQEKLYQKPAESVSLSSH